MSPLCEAVCRARDSPEGLTWPQKRRRGNCRLRQEAEPKGKPEPPPGAPGLVEPGWIQLLAGQDAVLCSGKPLCQVTLLCQVALGANTHLCLCAFNISFHNKAPKAETSLTRTCLSQHPQLCSEKPQNCSL